jgi:molybdenum cofactor biosynthesis protein B
MSTVKEHKRHAEEVKKEVKVSVITVSTSRYEKMIKGEEFSDESGDIIVSMLTKEGCKVVSRKLVKDDKELIRLEVMRSIYDDNVDAVIVNGGTGIARSDVTIETIRPMLDKEIEGFGEIFRFVSYQQIGTASYISRALAGVIGSKVIYCLPGSPNAVETGMKLILPEIKHVCSLATT